MGDTTKKSPIVEIDTGIPGLGLEGLTLQFIPGEWLSEYTESQLCNTKVSYATLQIVLEKLGLIEQGMPIVEFVAWCNERGEEDV